VDLGVALVAGPQAPEVVEVSEAALHDPALAAEPGAVCRSATRDHWCDPESPQQSPVLVVVIPAVGEDIRCPCAREFRGFDFGWILKVIGSTDVWGETAGARRISWLCGWVLRWSCSSLA
jgi:hypothetical protein